MNKENIELTEMWQDGKFEEVANIIKDSKEFSEKDRLIEFCLYFDKYLGRKELQVLHKFVQS
jgi:hypothetical protein